MGSSGGCFWNPHPQEVAYGASFAGLAQSVWWNWKTLRKNNDFHSNYFFLLVIGIHAGYSLGFLILSIMLSNFSWETKSSNYLIYNCCTQLAFILAVAFDTTSHDVPHYFRQIIQKLPDAMPHSSLKCCLGFTKMWAFHITKQTWVCECHTIPIS